MAENGNGKALKRIIIGTAAAGIIVAAVAGAMAWAHGTDRNDVLHATRLDALDAAQQRDRETTAAGLQRIEAALTGMTATQRKHGDDLTDIRERLSRMEGRSER